MNTTTRDDGRSLGSMLERGLGVTGRTALLGASGGGILIGGVLVAALTLAGRLSAGGLLLTTTGLFAVGAVLGFMHGGVLGYFGRSHSDGPAEALSDIGMAALYSIPALAASWVVAGWISMTVVAGYAGETAATVLTAAAWLVGATVLGGAAWQGKEAMANAYARWPHRRLGTLLVGGTFASLLVIFLVHRPEVWYLDLAVNEVGAVLLALGLTLWVAGPLVTGALHLVDRIPASGFEPGFRGGWTTSLLLGMTAGGLLALLSLPFHQTPLAAPTLVDGAEPLAAALAAVSQALVDELLLRLGVTTGVAWALLRWMAVSERRAAFLAVTAAAVVQVLLYTPGVMAIGFPGLLAAGGYLLVAVLVPALAFGFLYWYRGLGTAVVADATLLLAVALLV